MKKNAYNFQEGELLLIDKPLEWTSFDVVKKIRNLTKAKKVGHAGTLDPLATGLLIICTGKLTKQIDNYQAQQKEYTGTMLLGRTTPSFDLETDYNSQQPTEHITPEQIHQATAQFTGVIMQQPPQYSAIKVGGERVYKKARQGKTVKIEPRQVEVPTFEITGIKMPDVNFRVVCSKGTYIRSLAHDFGQAIGCGACLTQLTRTKIGDFSLQNAMLLSDFGQHIKTLTHGDTPRH